MIMVIGSLAVAAFATPAFGQVFGHKGGPDISNIAEIITLLRRDAYDLELLLSFGTSKRGSAGHLALAIGDQVPGDDRVYSANFYADRKPEHEHGHYNQNLICMVPKSEYLFKTTSLLGPEASFGLDMGEIYKRSVIGIRIFGVPPGVKEGLTAFFHRLNDDFHAQKSSTAYHDGPIVYGYMDLNCAKTVALAFKVGAGFTDVPIREAGLLSKLNVVSAARANLPVETAQDILRICAERGYGLDVVFYKKWDGSTYINLQDDDNRMYKDLPNRFPSALSLDYMEDQGHYEDYDNLYAMYLLYNLCKYSVGLDGATRRLKVEAGKVPDNYEPAREKAHRSATKDKKHVLRRVVFRAWGIKFAGKVDNRERMRQQAQPVIRSKDLTGVENPSTPSTEVRTDSRDMGSSRR
jgi:hypothetical protein